MRRFSNVLVLLGYLALSFAYFGWRLWPHPGRVVFGAENAPIYVWSFAWWPYAISHWTNPLVSHALYAPVGVNLAWTPTAPGLAFVFAPLTALAGPIVAYNVAGVIIPGLSAWTGYLLCRYLTRSMWASVVGGYLFGFSTASLRQVGPGNINLSAVFLFPLIALVVLRYLRGPLSGRGLAWRLGAVLAFQLTISTEFTAMVTFALAVSLVLAFWLVREQRDRLRSAVVPIVVGYGLAALFAAPFVYYLLFHFESGSVDGGLGLLGTDALAAFVPNGMLGIGGQHLPAFAARVSSRSAYLGLPTVVILIAYAVRARRTAGGRFVIAAFVAAFVATLGASLVVYGHTLLALPWWKVASHLPVLGDALPFRFAILEALAAAVAVALWIATTRGRVFRRPYVLPALAMAVLIPSIWPPSAYNVRRPVQLAFFADGLYKRCLSPGETIVVYPDGGDLLISQALAGFSFNLAQGGLQPFQKYGTPLNSFDRDPIVWDLAFVSWARPTPQRLLAFAGAHGVDRVISSAAAGYPSRNQMAVFGGSQTVGDAIVAPACDQPSLKTRNVKRAVEMWETNPQPYATRASVGWCLGTNYLAIPIGLTPLANEHPKIANYIQGTGLTCATPPPGYTQHGLAGVTLGVLGGTYPYWTRQA